MGVTVSWAPLLAASLVFSPDARAHESSFSGPDCGLEEGTAALSAAPTKDFESIPLGTYQRPQVQANLPTAAQALLHEGSGALAGKAVYLSPGHGWLWKSGAFRTQRGTTHGIVEDFVSTEAAGQYLAEYLRNMGAYVIPLRELDMSPATAYADNSDETSFQAFDTELSLGPSGYGYAVQQGPYGPDLNPFRRGDSYVFDANQSADAEVRWTLEVPQSGEYKVYVAYVQGPDRASDATYTVRHAGGESEFVVDQRRHGSTWVYLGEFRFEKGRDAAAGSIVLSGHSADMGATLSADVVRIGGGLSAAERNGTTHGRPSFEDSAQHYLQAAGAPTSIYNSSDVSARSRFAAWEHEAGEDAVYIAWHSNASNGSARGTSSFVYGPSSFGSINNATGVAGSVDLARAVHNEMVGDLRSAWDSEWDELGSGLFSAYFGEVNPSHNPEMPAALFEVAFHDNAEDAEDLSDPGFRRIASRAMAQGVAKYFAEKDGLELTLPPDEPRALSATQEDSGVLIQWQAPEGEAGGGDPADGYLVQLSRDGLAFDAGHFTQDLEYKVDYTDAVFARVIALNAGGRSFPSAVVGARPSVSLAPKVLVVNAFERLDSGQLLVEDLSQFALGEVKRMDVRRMNDRSYIARYGHAIDGAGVSFASTTRVHLGNFVLDDFEAVVWFSGQDLDVINGAEADRLRAYVQGGGALLFSGSHAADVLYRKHPDLWSDFGARLVGESTSFDLQPVANSGLELEEMSYLDEGVHAFRALGADSIKPQDNTISLLSYANGEIAATLRGRAALLAFPFETVAGETNRVSLMSELLHALEIEPDDAPKEDNPGFRTGDEESSMDGGGCSSAPGSSSAFFCLVLLAAFLQREAHRA